MTGSDNFMMVIRGLLTAAYPGNNHEIPVKLSTDFVFYN
jgi:hypothetical protein